MCACVHITIALPDDLYGRDVHVCVSVSGAGRTDFVFALGTAVAERSVCRSLNMWSVVDTGTG